MLRIILGLASFVLPVLLFAVAGVMVYPAYLFYNWLYALGGPAIAVMGLPLAYLIWGFSFCAFTILFKYITFHKTKEGSYSYASLEVARWAIMTRLVEFSNAILMMHLRSTPFIVIWFRLLGAKIGKDCYINTYELTDWDLLTIEDETMLGAGVVMQAHSAEAGKLHFRPVHIGKKCSVGRSSVVLPGVEMGERAILGAMSIAPKDLKMHAHSIWGGVPAKHIKDFKPKSES